MFGIWHRSALQLGQYWHVLIPDFETSTSEFYRVIREALDERRLPDIEVSEMDMPDGGIFSTRRRYLRIRKERLIFDVCSAPFGTSWFFSCRFGEIPLRLRWWECLIMAGLLVGILMLHVDVFGQAWGASVFVLNGFAAVFLLNSLVATELYGLDAALLRFPVIGAFYEKFFRGGSYYRVDTRKMFERALDSLIRETVEEFAGKRTGRPIQFQEDLEPTWMGRFGRVLDAIRIPWFRTPRRPVHRDDG